MKRRATHYASPTVSYNKNAIRLLDQKTPQHGQQNHKRIHIRTTTTITTKNTFSAFEKKRLNIATTMLSRFRIGLDDNDCGLQC